MRISGVCLISEHGPCGVYWTRSMKIVVQNHRTKCYLCDDDVWCENATRAKAFASSIVALRHCVDQRMPDTQIVVFFGDRRPPLVVPCEEVRV
jgi:hypothetical protein